MALKDPTHRLATLALVADDLRSGEFDSAAERASAEPNGMNPLIAAMLLGWAEVGRGDREAMEAAFARIGEQAAGRAFGDYHLGLARAAMGDFEGAAEVLRKAIEGGAASDGRPALALGAVLELSGRPDEAREIYVSMQRTLRGDPVGGAEIARMDRGEAASLPVRSARSGAAESLFSIAGALGGQENNATVALLYGRLAVALRPELHEARLLVGGLLSGQGQEELALREFDAVPRSSPLFISAEIGRADALLSLDREDEAIVALAAVAEMKPESLRAQLALAGALRRAERWSEASEIYDRGIALIDPVETRHWRVFYERGITHERDGVWDEAEADFLKALELQPDQPLVLNYLGYSWVEQRRNFDEAQAMIEKAVEARPEDGYITDSLGWVLYRIGKFEEAVPPLERAVELTPTDPIINDHLGDALWMVGRKLEARFQWRRALSFDPEEKEADRIRRKLDRGLDAVLRDEEAEATADAPEAAALDGG